MLPVIADVSVADERGGRMESAGEVALDKISGTIEKLKKALAPSMTAPVQGNLSLEQVEVALAVTVGGEVGIFAKGSFEGEASVTVTFARPSTK
jgi:hypothetical protein